MSKYLCFSSCMQSFENNIFVFLDVADALNKVEVLTQQLKDTEMGNQIVQINSNEKDAEIARLTDLNK